MFWFQKGFGNDKTGQVRLAASILSTSWATIKVSWQKVKMFDAAEWGIERFVAEGETDTVDQTESSWASEGEGIAFRLDNAPRPKGIQQDDQVD